VFSSAGVLACGFEPRLAARTFIGHGAGTPQKLAGEEARATSDAKHIQPAIGFIVHGVTETEDQRLPHKPTLYMTPYGSNLESNTGLGMLINGILPRSGATNSSPRIWKLNRRYPVVPVSAQGTSIFGSTRHATSSLRLPGAKADPSPRVMETPACLES